MQQLFKKFILIKTFSYVVIFVVLGYGRYRFEQKSPSDSFTFEQWLSAWMTRLCYEDRCFQIEIADEDAERKQGLMYRESLPSQNGMLFVFEQENVHSFWMKNTRIPLDMIRIDSDGKVIDIQTAEPCTHDPCQTYVPSWAGRYVLEINAGLSDLVGIQKWSILWFKKK